MSNDYEAMSGQDQLIKSLALSSAGVGTVCCLFELIKKELLELLNSKEIAVKPSRDGSYPMSRILDKFNDGTLLPEKLVDFFYEFKQFRNDVTHKYSLTLGPIDFSKFEELFKNFYLDIHFDDFKSPQTEREHLDFHMFVSHEGYESYADRSYSELMGHLCRSEVYDLSLYHCNGHDELKKDNLVVNIANNIHILLLATIVSDAIQKIHSYCR